MLRVWTVLALLGLCDSAWGQCGVQATIDAINTQDGAYPTSSMQAIAQRAELWVVAVHTGEHGKRPIELPKWAIEAGKQPPPPMSWSRMRVTRVLKGGDTVGVQEGAIIPVRMPFMPTIPTSGKRLLALKLDGNGLYAPVARNIGVIAQQADGAWVSDQQNYVRFDPDGSMWLEGKVDWEQFGTEAPAYLADPVQQDPEQLAQQAAAELTSGQ